MIVVHAPPGAAAAVASATISDGLFGPGHALDETMGPFAVGLHDVFAKVTHPQGAVTLHATLNVESGKTIQLATAGAQIRAAGAPTTFRLFENDIVSSTYVDGSGGPLVASSDVDVRPTADGSTIFPVGAGAHLFTWGFGDGVRLDAKAGVTTRLDIWDYSQRRVARIVAPASRDLPDGCSDKAKATLRLVNAWGDVFPGVDPWHIDLKAGSSFDIGQHPDAVKLLYKVDDLPIALALPCLRQRRVALGALGAGPADFHIGRLDVDHVDVTMGDGSVKQVPGTYQVYADGAAMLTEKLPTGTGIDLFAGSYSLVVEYPTSAGTTATSKQSITIP